MAITSFEREDQVTVLPEQDTLDPYYVDRELLEYGVAPSDIPQWKAGLHQLALAVAAERARITEEKTHES